MAWAGRNDAVSFTLLLCIFVTWSQFPHSFVLNYLLISFPSSSICSLSHLLSHLLFLSLVLMFAALFPSFIPLTLSCSFSPSFFFLLLPLTSCGRFQYLWLFSCVLSNPRCVAFLQRETSCSSIQSSWGHCPFRAALGRVSLTFGL